MVERVLAQDFEQELVHNLETYQHDPTLLSDFRTDLLGVELKGSYPTTALLLRFIDRRAGPEELIATIPLWQPEPVFVDSDGHPEDPITAATTVYTNLMEGMTGQRQRESGFSTEL